MGLQLSIDWNDCMLKSFSFGLSRNAFSCWVWFAVKMRQQPFRSTASMLAVCLVQQCSSYVSISATYAPLQVMWVSGPPTGA